VRITSRFLYQCSQLWPVAQGRIQLLGHDFRFADREVQRLVMLPTVDTEIDHSAVVRPRVHQHAGDKVPRGRSYRQQLLGEPCVLIAHCLSSREQAGSWEGAGLTLRSKSVSLSEEITVPRAAIVIAATFFSSSGISLAASDTRSLAFSAVNM